MFFFFPFGGGFGIVFLLFILLKLIVNSLAFRNSEKNSQRRQYQYRYYEFNQEQPYTQAKPKATSKAYETLGLTESASDEDVKKAYRKLTLEFHPDTIAGKGLSGEFTEFATKRFREIQEAYEEIRKERGIK